MTSPPPELTTADQLTDIISEHRFADHRSTFGDKCVCGWTRHDEAWSEHVAAVLEAAFVVVPKDQLHQEWTVQGICQEGDDCDHFGEHGEWVCGAIAESREEAAAFGVAKVRGAQLVSRWVGLWRPADSKEQT